VLIQYIKNFSIWTAILLCGESKSELEEFPIRLFKNKNKPYRLLAAEDKGDIIYAEFVEDRSKIAGNNISKEEFNEILSKEGWERDDNTVDFTFFDGEFIRREWKNHL
jgi:hypothetical protein